MNTMKHTWGGGARRRLGSWQTLTRVQALHPQGQPGLGDGDELQGDVELAASEVTQPGGAAELRDLNTHNS